MAVFRNDTGSDITIDRFGLYVPAGATFEIPDHDEPSLTGQPDFPAVDVPADVPLDVAVADADAPDAGADAPSEPSDASDAPSDVSDVASETADAPEVSTDADEAPSEDEAPAGDVPADVELPDAVDLDSFTQA